MKLETNRLILREMTPEDLPALSEILQDDQTMLAYEGAFSDAEVVDWLNRQLDRYQSDGFGLWAVLLRDSNKLIGQCGLTWQEAAGEKVLEIGYL
jgi:RimJ/RimL family protein N-acetyltransferase